MATHWQTVNRIINEYDFDLWARIELKNGTIDFVKDSIRKDLLEPESSTYLWVETDEFEWKTSYKLKYIGRAGKTISKRCREHKQGLKNGVSTKGDKIKKILHSRSNPKRILVFVRPSPQLSPFTVGSLSTILVPFNYVEEITLIKYFRDLYEGLGDEYKIWNKA
jgi:hypothetical protein